MLNSPGQLIRVAIKLWWQNQSAKRGKGEFYIFTIFLEAYMIGQTGCLVGFGFDFC